MPLEFLILILVHTDSSNLSINPSIGSLGSFSYWVSAMLIFSSLYLPLCLSSLGCNSLPCVLTLCMQELLFFQFVQGLLVGKMEWWLPNSLHGKLEIGSPPLTFQSFLRVIVARCIDRFFFLYFSILKISLFLWWEVNGQIYYFSSVCYFFQILWRFSLKIWFLCSLI